MKIFLDILASLAAAAVVGATLYTLLRRLEAFAVSNGVIPGPELADLLRRSVATNLIEIDPSPEDFSTAEAMASERPMPPNLAGTMTTREHMQVVDVHLLRAQDYVVALGADGHGPELALLFKRIRLARRALLDVARGPLSHGDE